uniref:N-acetylmuramoyl-L-alanine amidase n=1 Tax=Syphacia muris TaxID=451379 RepID=A0A0N5AUV0_9BILA
MIGYLKERKEKYGLWMVGIVNDPAASNRLFFQRAVTSAEANAVAKENGAHYWEVIPDGKTARSPLAYNQIITEIISTIGNYEISALPKKIPLEFNGSEVKRKVFRSCEHLKLINAQM